MRLAVLVTSVALATGPTLAGCGGGEKPEEALPSARETIEIASPAFDGGQTIPSRFTCDGEDVSPPLTLSGVPMRARELALLVEDPDADRFVHWTLLRIPPNTTDLGTGAVPPGSVETENSFGDRGWGGPCPPEGEDAHRYVFALYGLSRPLELDADASPDEVRSAIDEVAIARGRLTAEYGR
jgi:Raf kinase inhibitor-like YbhB/YbcL family protein